MHSLFGEWYRKASIQPRNEDLVARWKAIEAFTKKVDATRVLELVRCFSGVPQRAVTVIEEFQNELLANDAAFPVRNNVVEMQVLAGAALASIFEQRTAVADLAAMALEVAAARGFRKLPVVPEIVELAEQHIASRSVALRVISPRNKIAGGKHDAAIEAVKAACATNSPAQLGQPLEAVLKTLSESIGKIAQLAEVAAATLVKADQVQSEESSIIWWLFGGYSRDVNKRFSDLPPSFAAVLVAKELADLTRLTPGPRAAVAYLDHALQHAPEKKLALSDVAAEVPGEWIQQLPLDHSILDFSPIMFMLAEIKQGRKGSDAAATTRRQLQVAATGHSPLQVSVQAYREFLTSRTVGK